MYVQIARSAESRSYQVSYQLLSSKRLQIWYRNCYYLLDFWHQFVDLIDNNNFCTKFVALLLTIVDSGYGMICFQDLAIWVQIHI